MTKISLYDDKELIEQAIAPDGTALAYINEYYGGKYARYGYYLARIRIKRFANGKIKHTDFDEIEVIKVIEKGYGYGTAKKSKSIACLVIE